MALVVAVVVVGRRQTAALKQSLFPRFPLYPSSRDSGLLFIVATYLLDIPLDL
jgi:hypothetical protein